MKGTLLVVGRIIENSFKISLSKYFNRNIREPPSAANSENYSNIHMDFSK